MFFLNFNVEMMYRIVEAWLSIDLVYTQSEQKAWIY